MSDDKLAARRERRGVLLRALYDQVDSSVSAFVDGFELGETLGLDRAETTRILEYLAEKGLIKVDDYTTGQIRLTAAGVDYVGG